MRRPRAASRKEPSTGEFALRDRLLRDPALRQLVSLALAEDGVEHDLTSQALLPEGVQSQALLTSREACVAAGLFLLDPSSPLMEAFPETTAITCVGDGDLVKPEATLARLRGPAVHLLGLERTLLNFLQRLCGIATLTRRYVEAVSGTSARIQDTRKTCPGWRLLDKYAVALGGGLNHRLGLHDQVLVKENHLVFTGGRRSPQAAADAVAQARARSPEGTVIEVEVEDIEQFRASLEAGPDVIMLDDFTDSQVAQAVAACRAKEGRRPLIEVSGGVDLPRAVHLASLGVDRISVGALTHSVRAIDLALKITPEEEGW